MIAVFSIAAIVGIGIGVISGLLGIGGGTIMVPLFRLAFGMSAVSSTATSLFTIIPTSISGGVAHITGKTCLVRMGIVLGIGGACMSPLGVWLAQMSPSWLVMLAAALAIGYSAATMLSKALKNPKTRTEAKSGAIASYANDDIDGNVSKAINGQGVFPAARADWLKTICVGAITGLVSGYVGLGGGFLMVPLMLSFLRVPMRLVSGTSLIGIMILALPATIVQCALGNVDYLVGIGVACGSIPGAIIGAKLAPRVPERVLRLMFGALLGVAAILLIARELSAMGFAIVPG